MSYERDQTIPEDLVPKTYIDSSKPIGTIVDSQFDAYYRGHEKMSWSLTTFGDSMRAVVDPKNYTLDKKTGLVLPEFKPELVRPSEVAALTMTMYVESHNPVYSATLNSYPPNRMDFRETDFLALWSYEEYKHFRASLMYLEGIAVVRRLPNADPRVPVVDIDSIKEKLGLVRAGKWGELESKFTRVQSHAYQMLQELFANLIYSNAAAESKEPLLKDLYSKMGKDEMRHHAWFYDRTREDLHPDPERPDYLDPQAYQEFVELLMLFNMPGGTFVPDFQQNTEYSQSVANPGSKIGKILVKKIEDLIGKKQLDDLLGKKDFRASLEERGISKRDIFALRMMRKMPIGR